MSEVSVVGIPANPLIVRLFFQKGTLYDTKRYCYIKDPLQLRIVFFYISHMFHNRKHTEYFFIFGEFNDFSIEQYKFL